MTYLSQRFSLTATALAAAALLAACGGGGSASAPADTVPPTLQITNTTNTTSGDITFTFSFNEAVSGFDTTDVTVEGGTKGAFINISNQSATLVVTPTASSVKATVATGKFSDVAGNLNTQATESTVTVSSAFLSFDENPAKFSDMGAFGGALPTLDNAPAGGNLMALKIVKPSTGQAWGGIYFTIPPIPFTSTQKGLSAKVWSSVANSVVRLKVETSGSFVEVSGTVTGSANSWSTVTWDLSGIDLNSSYTVIAITPDKSRTPDDASYYIDDIRVIDTPTAFSSLTFDETPAPVLVGFGLGTSSPSEIVNDPAGGSNKVLKVYKNTDSNAWGGVTVMAGSYIPIAATSSTITLKVYSPAVGLPIRFKVENDGDDTITYETQKTTTSSGAWEIITFDFATPVSGTPAWNANKVYNKASIFPEFGYGIDGWATGPMPANRIYYFDNLTLVP